jgi:hypothetical protein
VILVDDHLLAERFRDDSFGPLTSPLATTCCWWWRLSAAVNRGRRGGALTARLGDGDLDRAVRAIDALPDVVQVVDIRTLVPMMSRIATTFRLNLLAAEALASAITLGADIVVGQDTPRLREAARVRGVTYLVEA